MVCESLSNCALQLCGLLYVIYNSIKLWPGGVCCLSLPCKGVERVCWNVQLSGKPNHIPNVLKFSPVYHFLNEFQENILVNISDIFNYEKNLCLLLCIDFCCANWWELINVHTNLTNTPIRQKIYPSPKKISSFWFSVKANQP